MEVPHSIQPLNETNKQINKQLNQFMNKHESMKMVKNDKTRIGRFDIDEHFSIF